MQFLFSICFKFVLYWSYFNLHSQNVTGKFEINSCVKVNLGSLLVGTFLKWKLNEKWNPLSNEKIDRTLHWRRDKWWGKAYAVQLHKIRKRVVNARYILGPATLWNQLLCSVWSLTLFWRKTQILYDICENFLRYYNHKDWNIWYTRIA